MRSPSNKPLFLVIIILKKGVVLASGFFALLDDISILMDDVASMSKVAAKKTSAILGDDLAVNASKASNFSSSRELPVLWAITKGSFINKLILIPAIMALNYYFPHVVHYVLLVGALYIAYEGVHGLWGYIFPHNEHGEKKQVSEKEKIKSAIITDFILSIEIVLIALDSVKEASFTTQVVVVSLVAFGATIGVYSLVAFLVRLDDIGFAIAQNEPEDSFKYKFGQFLIKSLPFIIKALSVIGVFAMLLVAGSIFVENFKEIEELIPGVMGELIAAIIIGGFVMLFIDGGKFLIEKINL
jgi:predicted DNA repair protein MutK